MSVTATEPVPDMLSNSSVPSTSRLPVTLRAAAVTVPVKEGLAVLALVATATAILSNSELISVPLTILLGLPEAKESLVAKFVVFV